MIHWYVCVALKLVGKGLNESVCSIKRWNPQWVTSKLYKLNYSHHDHLVFPGTDGCKNIVYRSSVGHFCYLWLSVAGDGPWADPEKMFWKLWSIGSNGARNENSESSWLDDTTEVRRSSSRWTVPGSNPPLAVWLPLKKVPQASFVCFTSFNTNFKSYSWH